MRFPSLHFISGRRRSADDGDQDEELRIEPMRLPDVDQVLVTERLAYPTPWSRRAFISELTENAYAHYQVARLGKRVVGHIGLWIVAGEAHITNVAVHPGYRGRGFGRMILQAAIDLAQGRGCTRVTLEVRRTNEVAKSLYRSFGFREVGVRKGYYTDNGEDALIMIWGVAPEDEKR